MDVVWDQDVRAALSAIIAREAKTEPQPEASAQEVTRHCQLAVRYANEMAKARADQEKRGGRPEVSHRPSFSSREHRR